MSLLQLIISLVVIGFLMWLINTYIPMQEGIKKVLNIVIVIVVVVYVLIVFGVLGSVGGLHLRGF